jgi:hypothetical protein
MPTELIDEDYGRRLGDRLHAAVADVEPRAHLAATVRRQYTRRTLLVRATTGVAAAAAVAAAGGTVQAIRYTGSDQMRDVAYVRTQALNALKNAKNYVVHATIASSGRLEHWVDRVSGDRRIDSWGPNKARIYSMSSTSEKDRFNAIIVYYEDRTWVELRKRYFVGRGWIDVFDPESIRAALGNGTLRLLGKDRIDGHAVLHLRKEDSLGGNTVFHDYWVDAKSFLVRRTSARTGNEPGRVITYEWLPRTAENLAHFKLTPPPGFKKIN